jgi:hypothetical protein
MCIANLFFRCFSAIVFLQLLLLSFASAGTGLQKISVTEKIVTSGLNNPRPIVIADIDNDKKTEIIVDCNNNGHYWCVVKFNMETNDYASIWTSDMKPSVISAFNVDGNGIWNIYELSHQDSSTIVEWYDAQSFKRKGLKIFKMHFNQLAFGDPDNDGHNEIIFSDQSSIYLYDAISFSFKRKFPYAADKVLVGNIYADNQNEIITSNGMVLHVQGDSTICKWEKAFTGDFELSDIDGDGMKEIIVAWRSSITAFDADQKKSKWIVDWKDQNPILATADVNGDGKCDVIVGGNPAYLVYCFNGPTGASLWQFESEVIGLNIGDVDNDGVLELLLGVGPNTDDDHLLIYGTPPLKPKWSNTLPNGPYDAIQLGDIDNDKNDEVLIATRFTYSTWGIAPSLLIYNPRLNKIIWQSTLKTFSSPQNQTTGNDIVEGINDVKACDIDHDGSNEILVAADNWYDGAIYILKGENHDLTNLFFYREKGPIQSFDTCDIDKDGITDIVALGSGQLLAIDPQSGTIKYESRLFPSEKRFWDNCSFDIYYPNDGALPQVIVLNDSLYIFDNRFNLLWKSNDDLYSGLSLCDIDHDNNQEIVAGRRYPSEIDVINIKTKEIKRHFLPMPGLVNMRCRDVDQDGSFEFILSLLDDNNNSEIGKIAIYDMSNSLLLWASNPLSAEVGNNNNIITMDNASHGVSLLVGTRHKLYEFQANKGNSNVRAIQMKQNAQQNSKHSNDFESSLDQRNGFLAYDCKGRVVSLPNGNGHAIDKMKIFGPGVYFIKNKNDRKYMRKINSVR